jgi:polysaccharide biosynthesis/export protein
MLAGRRIIFTMILGFSVAASPVLAQSLPAIPQSLLDQLQRQQGGDNGETAIQQPLPTGTQARVGTTARQVADPVAPTRTPTPTPLEADYSARAGTNLRLFGRNVFADSASAAGAVTGTIRDSYVMGFGDEIVVTLRGQVSRSYRTRVGRDGQVVLPDLPPVPAVGRSFADFRSDLDAVVRRSYVNSDVFVSLGEVRQISVLMTGEVKVPGQKQLSAFSTLVDALSGQLAPGASLRNITLTRDGQTRTIDLYSLLTASSTKLDLGLVEGDQIAVAPLGATIAIAGDVGRPAIYEIPRGGIAPRALVDLAGGFLRPAGNRLIRISFEASGKQRVTEIAETGRATLAPGDVLLVGKREDIQTDEVSLYGRVRVPGERALAQAPTVRALLGRGSVLGIDPYLPFGVLLTVDPVTQVRHMESIDLAAVLAGTRDYPLRSLDTLIVLGKDDVAYLSSADVQAILTGRVPPSLAASRPLRAGESVLLQGSPQTRTAARTARPPGDSRVPSQAAGAAATNSVQASESDAVYDVPYLVSSSPLGEGDPSVDKGPASFDASTTAQGCPALQTLASIVQSSSGGRFSNAVQLASGDDGPQGAQSVQPCPGIMSHFPDLLPFMVEHAITVRGEVRQPGIYPIGSANLAEVVAAAGGVTRSADFKNIEVSHFTIDGPQGSANVQRQTLSLALADFARVPLFTGDVVHFNAVYDRRDTGPVVLSGEFKQPGTFDIRRGEKLSELIRRAGGLTDDAYPYGAVLTRASAQRTEQDGLDRSIRQIDAGLTSAVVNASGANANSTASTIASLQSAMSELRSAKPLGRVVFEADPATLASRPDLDIILEPGDRIAIPKRPSSVAISGDVLNPSSQQFEAGLSPEDYIKHAGGYLSTADTDHVFVVLPNGAAEPVDPSMWNFSKVAVPPGSTIVVPRDLSPDTLSLVRDVTQVLGQVAITAASLAVINN